MKTVHGADSCVPFFLSRQKKNPGKDFPVNFSEPIANGCGICYNG